MKPFDSETDALLPGRIMRYHPDDPRNKQHGNHNNHPDEPRTREEHSNQSNGHAQKKQKRRAPLSPSDENATLQGSITQVLQTGGESGSGTI